MGRCTRSQGLAAFRSSMAARFWQNQIPQKNLALLHDLETCHELKSISRSFVEVHSYPKLFFHCRVAKSGLLYEKEEAYSSHVSRHIPKIIQPPMEGQIQTGLGCSKIRVRQVLISIFMILIPLISFNYSFLIS